MSVTEELSLHVQNERGGREEREKDVFKPRRSCLAGISMGAYQHGCVWYVRGN